jgi:hypothetical protein
MLHRGLAHGLAETDQSGWLARLPIPRLPSSHKHGACRVASIDATIIALAGHLSRKILEHYSHIWQEAKREALNVLSARHKP